MCLCEFGKWQEILDEKLEHDPKLFCLSNAICNTPRIAHAVLGNIGEAAHQGAKLEEAWGVIPPERIVFQNDARDIIAVAMEMLDGETEYKRGNYSVAFDHLRTAVAKYDTLNYAEPWSWMMPPRHALGALLLEQVPRPRSQSGLPCRPRPGRFIGPAVAAPWQYLEPFGISRMLRTVR